MTKEEKQAALEALDSSVEGGTFCVHFPQEYQTIHAALTAQDVAGNVESGLIKRICQGIEYLEDTYAMRPNPSNQSIDYEFGHMDLTLGDLKTIHATLTAQKAAGE